MIAHGNPSWRNDAPILGRTYANSKGPSIMAKAKALLQSIRRNGWEGLSDDRPAGTYIRLHTDGTYEYGRWWHSWLGHWRFEKIGEASTREACRAGLVEADKACERRSNLLNKRRRGA